MGPKTLSATVSMTLIPRLVCSGTVCNVTAATRCTVCPNVVIAYQFEPLRGDRVAGMVAEWFSHYERRIFQSATNTSLQLEEELERGVWDSLQADNWTWLSNEGNSIATTYKETHSLSRKNDVQTILLQPMLEFYEVVVLIRETRVFAARSEVCIEVGFSSSLPSSVPHEIVFSVATSAG